VRLAATWRPNPARSDAPAVLLVHDFSRERREWTALAEELAVLGFETLALDLRGHGESTQQDGKPNVRPSPTLLRSPSGFPRDIEAACAWLRERATAVGVVGVSVGGSPALLATASAWADAAVAISVNTDRLPFLAGGRPRHAKGTLVLATEKDLAAKASAEEIHSAAEEPKGMKVYPGAAQLALLAEHPDAKQLAFAWLTTRLTTTISPSNVTDDGRRVDRHENARPRHRDRRAPWLDLDPIQRATITKGAEGGAAYRAKKDFRSLSLCRKVIVVSLLDPDSGNGRLLFESEQPMESDSADGSSTSSAAARPRSSRKPGRASRSATAW
jgi:dienelactone hydrolase